MIIDPLPDLGQVRLLILKLKKYHRPNQIYTQRYLYYHARFDRDAQARAFARLYCGADGQGMDWITPQDLIIDYPHEYKLIARLAGNEWRAICVYQGLIQHTARLRGRHQFDGYMQQHMKIVELSA